MLANAIRQVKLAADGWKNLAFRNKDAEILAEMREAVCNRCKHKQRSTCGLCGCPLAAKLRAPGARCPDGRW